jgi:hypothetical protein
MGLFVPYIAEGRYSFFLVMSSVLLPGRGQHFGYAQCPGQRAGDLEFFAPDDRTFQTSSRDIFYIPPHFSL